MKNDLARMQELINYKTGNNSATNMIENTVLASNGKTYAIVKEGLNYYIKSSDKKGDNLMLEDFDYIGGFMERKKNCYNSYTKASQQLNLKLMAIDEATGKHTNKLNESNVTSEWQLDSTKEVRSYMDDFKRLDESISKILNESEEPVRYDKKKTNPNKKTLTTPYTDDATKRNTKKHSAEVYNEKAKYVEDFESKDGGEEEIYTEKLRQPYKSKKAFKPVVKESTHFDKCDDDDEFCIEIVTDEVENECEDGKCFKPLKKKLVRERF